MEDSNAFNDSGKKPGHPFKVPENYFAQLPVQIADRVHKEKIDYSFWPKYRIQFAVAASLIGLLLAVFLINPMKQNTDAKEILADVPDEAIQEYLETENIAYEEILAFADNEDLLFDPLLIDLSEEEESTLEEEILF